MMTRIFLIATAAAALAMGSLLPQHVAAGTRPPVAVSIRNFTFSPRHLRVSVGQTIVWTNRDSTQHTVSSDAGSTVTFNSKSLDRGRTFRLTFAKPGTYRYHCSYHFFMSGTIVVSRR